MKDNLLRCPYDQYETCKYIDTKEIYKVYGLFLSACSLKKINEVELPPVAIVVEAAEVIKICRLLHEFSIEKTSRSHT